MIAIEHHRHDDVIELRASGTLTTNDYETAIPELEHAMELSEGPLRILVRLEDFRGWEIGALWRELEFDLEHRGDLGRIAVIGETKYEEWGTSLSAPFTKAGMRFFTTDNEADAYEWLGSKPSDSAGLPGNPGSA